MLEPLGTGGATPLAEKLKDANLGDKLRRGDCNNIDWPALKMSHQIQSLEKSASPQHTPGILGPRPPCSPQLLSMPYRKESIFALFGYSII